MPSFPYKNFLEAEEDLKAAKAYWAKLCQEEIPVTERLSWIQWLSQVADSDERSATVCSLWNEVRKKGLIIEQLRPKREGTYVGARMDVFGEGHLLVPIDFIVIWCELSQDAARIVRRLVHAWTDPNTTSQQIEQLIAEFSIPGDKE